MYFCNIFYRVTYIIFERMIYMNENFCDVVDKAYDLCALLESIDDIIFDFYSENYTDFNKSIGTYKLMKCRFEENGAKLEIARDRIIEAIKASRELRTQVNYFHKNL